MAWIQGLVTPGQIVGILKDAMVANGWTVVDEPGAEDVVLQTTTSPEGAIRAPKAVQASLTGASATGTGLLGSTAYDYAVTAVGPKGESVASQRVTVTQPATPERVKVSWRPVDGARSYYIYRAVQGGTLERIGSTEGPCSAWIDDGAEPQTGKNPPAGETLTIMARIKRPRTTGITVTMMEDWDDATGQAVNPSFETRVDWWNVLTSLTSPAPTPFGESNMVYYFGSVNNNRIAMVFYGDPTLDFEDYRLGFLYLGRLVPFPESGVDVANNFALMGHAGTTAVGGQGGLPDPNSLNQYGPYTSDGMRWATVYKTRSGLLYQRHSIALVTEPSTMQLEGKGFNPSQWTEKYHLSPVYLVHGYDGYRGWLEDVLAVRDHNVVHLDEFIITHPDGGEDRYKYFSFADHADTWPMGSNSPNKNYSLAILKD